MKNKQKKPKLTSRKLFKGGKPVRESPITYRIPEADAHLKGKIETTMRRDNCSRSDIITRALNQYFAA